MTYKELKELLDAKNILVQDVLSVVGYTRAGFMRAIDNETIELRKLKILCDAVRIQPALFFQNDFGLIQKQSISNSDQTNQDLKRENKMLRDQIEDKNKIIELLSEKNNPYFGVAENKPKLETYLKTKK